MKKKEVIELLKDHLPSGLYINSSSLSDNITEINGGYEFYIRSARLLEGNDEEGWANSIERNIDVEVDSRSCGRDYDFYIFA